MKLKYIFIAVDAKQPNAASHNESTVSASFCPCLMYAMRTPSPLRTPEHALQCKKYEIGPRPSDGSMDSSVCPYRYHTINVHGKEASNITFTQSHTRRHTHTHPPTDRMATGHTSMSSAPGRRPWIRNGQTRQRIEKKTTLALGRVTCTTSTEEQTD